MKMTRILFKEKKRSSLYLVRMIVWWVRGVMVLSEGVRGVINKVHRINAGTSSVLAIMNILLSVS